MKRYLTIILFLALAAPLDDLKASASGGRPSEEASKTPDAEEASINVNLSELSSDPKKFEGKVITTGGILIQTTPSYFPKPIFMITNGVDKVRVSSWLPLEVAPSPKGLKKQRRKVMSDFLDKYVIISGRVVLEDGRPLIEVRDAKAE